ncbi:MAG: hypothetical protein JWN86_1843 [Planctomycetota bacterium]|nr:hypothetical protein [Planctomycetota bacterium]
MKFAPTVCKACDSTLTTGRRCLNCGRRRPTPDLDALIAFVIVVVGLAVLKLTGLA